LQKKARQNQPDTLCSCQRGFRVTALLIRSVQLRMTGIQSRPENNRLAIENIKDDIENGYTAFIITLKM
ncbi:hypothetical protein ACSLPA_33395, partial [Escherichia coli]